LARYTGASCRICRRENLKLYLKGERCYTDKCSFDKRSYAPGQHGQNRFRKQSDYAIQLREKQKVRRMYGMLEGQFRAYFKEADRRKGVTGEILLQLLEQIVRKLIEEKTKFKITFEGKDIIVRFDIDHFVKITDKDIKVAGFQNENDGVLGSIYPLLSKYGKVLFLRVVK